MLCVFQAHTEKKNLAALMTGEKHSTHANSKHFFSIISIECINLRAKSLDPNKSINADQTCDAVQLSYAPGKNLKYCNSIPF